MFWESRLWIMLLGLFFRFRGSVSCFLQPRHCSRKVSGQPLCSRENKRWEFGATLSDSVVNGLTSCKSTDEMMAFYSGIKNSDKLDSSDQEELSSATFFHDPLAIQNLVSRAFPDDRGARASALNACLGHFYVHKYDPQCAVNLLDNFRDYSIQPDLISYSLVYSMTQNESFLLEAEKLAKKQGGSKRRKQLNSLKRKKTFVSVREQLPDLQSKWNDFDVLYEDDQIAIVSKPSGVVCYHERIVKGHHNDASMTDALMIQLSTLSPTMGVVHRLDRGTSGCLVLAKTNKIHARLVAEFFVRNIQKEYLAVVKPKSNQPFPESGSIHENVRGKPAYSEYSVVSKSSSDSPIYLISVKTRTGRRHQVRIHCAEALEAVILGDVLYGEAEILPQQFLLHASRISIPFLNVSVEASIPSWWGRIMDECGLHL